MIPNSLTHEIIGCAYKVHSALGPGLLESAYQACLYYELINAGLRVEKEKPLPIVYHEIKLDCGYRIDMVVEDQVLLELKVVDALNEVHLAQILTYLKFSKVKLGYLLNFNVVSMKTGIKRVIL